MRFERCGGHDPGTTGGRSNRSNTDGSAKVTQRRIRPPATSNTWSEWARTPPVAGSGA